MRYAIKLVVLFILSFLPACLITPGIEEPHIIKCAILGDLAECSDLKTDDRFEVPVSQLLGYSCVSPSHSAKIKNHHDALHLDLNRCLKKD